MDIRRIAVTTALLAALAACSDNAQQQAKEAADKAAQATKQAADATSNAAKNAADATATATQTPVGTIQSSHGSGFCQTRGSNPPHQGMFARSPPPNCSIQRYSAWAISLERNQANDAAVPAAQLPEINLTMSWIRIATII